MAFFFLFLVLFLFFPAKLQISDCIALLVPVKLNSSFTFILLYNIFVFSVIIILKHEGNNMFSLWKKKKKKIFISHYPSYPSCHFLLLFVASNIALEEPKWLLHLPAA